MERSVLVVTHKYADPDALASALLIGRLYESRGYSVDYYFPQGLNRQAKRLLERLFPGLGYFASIRDLPDKNYEEVIIVDTSNPQQVPGFEELAQRARAVRIYDHHRASKDVLDELRQVLGPKLQELRIFESPSLSESIYSMLHEELVPDPKLAAVLLAGIVTDTKFLKLATPRTLEIARELESLSKLSIAELRKLLLENVRDISRRIALIKAFKRARFFRVGKDLIVGLTHSSSFESDVASMLTQCCADLAVVLAYKKSERLLRIALRSYSGVPEELTAYRVAEILAKELEASWGGHKHAAALELRVKDSGSKREVVEKYLNKVLEILSHALGTHSRAHKEITI